MTAPDFPTLKKARDASWLEAARKMHIELGGDPNKPPSFHVSHADGCYCDCPDGPCEHNFKGGRDLLDERGRVCGFEAVCTLCGAGAMNHSMRVGP